MRTALRVLALLAALALGTALAAGYPVTVEDDLGREVTLNAAPQRIVSMAPMAEWSLLASTAVNPTLDSNSCCMACLPRPIS